MALHLGLGLGIGHLPSQGVGDVFDYYVDPSTAVSGTGIVASPYTVAQLNALSGSIANKRIGLKSGTSITADTLNPTITLTDNGLYVGVYGYGTAPTIDLRKTISGAWTSLGGNLWRHSGTQVSDGSASGNVFRNGIPMKLVQTTPAADGEAVVAVWNWSGVRGVTSTTSFSVDIYSVADPTSDGYTYTYSSSTYAIQLSGNDCTIAGKSGALITAKGPLHQGGAFRLTGSRPVIRFTRVEHASRHAILVGPNALVEDNQFYDINRASLTIATIRVQGLNCIANRNVSGTQGYPASAVTSGNTAPNYATLPPMSRV